MYKYFYNIFYFFVFLFFTFLCFAQHVHAQQIAIPSITPYWIKRATYDTSTALVLSKGKSSQTAQESFFANKSLLTGIPSVVGGASIVAGSILAWLGRGKKQKQFKKYMEMVTSSEKVYSQAKIKNPKTAGKQFAQLKDTFSKLQEEVDLAAANRKIDDQQRTTIENTIQRKLEELLIREKKAYV